MNAKGLTYIGHVEETENIAEVNANIKNGWKLLLAYTYAPDENHPENLRSVYSLGWPENLGEPVFVRIKSANWAPDQEIY